MHAFLDPSNSNFVHPKTFVTGSKCVDQTLYDIDIVRVEDHIKVKALALGHPMGTALDIIFDWLCLSPLPFPVRDVGIHFGHRN